MTVQRETTEEERIELAKAHAKSIDASAARRKSAPVRSVFARDETGAGDAPMAQLIKIGGRGGGVALKLYLSLIWRSAAYPFTTSIPTRKWAELLALPDPGGKGSRRISDAFRVLERLELIATEPQPGAPSLVTMLHEDGTGKEYRLPRGGEADRYFHVPAALWVSGDMQRLSAPAVGMLLAVLSDQRAPGADVWWSTQRFPGRFGLSSATRARGTSELTAAGLLDVRRAPVTLSSTNSFAPDRVRNVYRVIGPALLDSPTTAAQVAPAKRPPRKLVARRGAGTAGGGSKKSKVIRKRGVKRSET